MTRTRPRRLLALSRAGAAAVATALLIASMPLSAAQVAPRFRGEPVTLNFVNADIEGVTRAMAAILRQQFIVDPRVKGSMTLYSEDPLTPNEAYLNFLAALRGLGFTVVEVGGLFKVVPEADAKLQAGTVSIDSVSRRGDQVITQIFRLEHENANNLVPVLRPLITPNNTINANPSNNTLVITDYADNLQRIAKIIAAMDVPSSGDVEVITLRYAVASDVAPLVQRMTDTPATPGAAGTAAGAAGATAILVEPRSNSLLVRSSNASKMASIRSLVAKLDLPPPGGEGTGNIWVVHLNNADVTKLATVLRAAFSAASGGNPGASGGGGSSTSSPLSANAPGAAGTGNTSSAAAAPITASAGPSTGGFIQADPATNSLIISAPEPLYRQVRAMIEKLDTRRAQVYIESLIVEVTGDNAANFGFQWQGLLTGGNNNNGIVAGSNFGTAGNLLNITQAQLTGGAAGITLGEGLNVGLVHNFFGTYGLAAIANILQSQTNTNIASTPNLVTLDNEEAKIVVGSNVPFVTGQYTQTGTTGALSSPFQTIERKDVGITLRIRPQIGENGTIRMSIFQESSSLSALVAPGTSNAGPSTDKRSIETNVVVDDGQILVLGGLIEDKYTENRSKIPLLGDIPYIGALFRSESREKTRTNLMVFLRPVVMRDPETSNRLSLERYELIRSFQKDMQPPKSLVVPINDSPIVPPLQQINVPAQPLAAPPSSPGTTPGPLQRPKTPPLEPGTSTTVVVPVIVPAPPPAAPAPSN
ncbi:MAG: type II secretion system secretin GspD [Pseudomonadota bacterium]|nr:type II secretion system secretin GspD [Pseudomonadota bacterium]